MMSSPSPGQVQTPLSMPPPPQPSPQPPSSQPNSARYDQVSHYSTVLYFVLSLRELSPAPVPLRPRGVSSPARLLSPHRAPPPPGPPSTMEYPHLDRSTPQVRRWDQQTVSHLSPFPLSPAPSCLTGNPGSVMSPPGSTSLEDQQYMEKLKQLSKYIEPLRRMINKIDKNEGQMAFHPSAPQTTNGLFNGLIEKRSLDSRCGPDD